MPTRSLHFENRRGRRLAARLDLPEGGTAHATAVLAHCFTCGKDLKGLVRLSRTLVAHGFAVMRLDFTGLGESEGEFAEAGLGGDADDLEDAAHYLEQEIAAPSLLIGHSLGGLAALLVAPRLTSLDGLVTIGTPSDPRHVKGLLGSDLDAGAEDGRVEAVIAGRTFRLPQAFLDEVDQRTPADCLLDLHVPVMILHAVTDEVVAIEHAERLFKAAKHPKSFVSLGTAGHLLPREADARYAGHVIGGWAAGLRGARGDEDGIAPPDGRPAQGARLPERATRATTRQGYATQGYAGGFPLRLDEPEDVGGTDTGPSPSALLRLALAGCTAITVRMYADRKAWPLEAIQVDVTSESKRAQGTTRSRFERRIRLDGDLDEEQRARLIDIAGRCPVHRTLEGEVSVDTSEA
ncbi:MAG: alpha/beta fold hydrolase [Trueperaceae bacterium]|nr:alpha/beta fold hydrolase [Trueperaceae bacterium]